MKETKRRIILYSFALAAIAGLSFLVGFVLSDQVLVPSATVLKVKTAIRNMLRPDEDLTDGTKRIVWSTFLPLEVTEFEVPVERRGAGGGLTSIGNTLVVLTHEGRLFGLTDDSKVSPLDIQPPDNGYDEYLEAALDKYAHLTHAPEFFRYNDVMYFENDGHAGLAVSYTEWLDDKECYGTTIAILDLPIGLSDLLPAQFSQAEWRVLFRTQPCLSLKETSRAIEGHMAGGRIAFKPPNNIVLGSGDYHWDGMYAPLAHAQIRSNDYGKVIEIDLNTGEARHLSIGNRNVQGITVDSEGNIWAVEHGPRGGDELNRIVEGANFGWPQATLGTRYNKLPISSSSTVGRHDGFDAPTFAWLPSIGVSNIMQVSDFDASWDGDLLVASLSAQTVYRLRMTDDRVMFAETIEVGHRVRYAHQHTSDSIFLWTDEKKLLRLFKAGNYAQDIAVTDLIEKMGLNRKRQDVLRTNLDRCMECHSFSQGDNVKAPHLANVYGRKIGSTSFGDYSTSLRSLPGYWNDESLSSYLGEPLKFAPGTNMPDTDLSVDSVADIVLLLSELSKPE